MVIGVFGGSFNPVHAGHISLAREVVARKLADKVVMVLSPLNPLKEDPASLIDDYLRMEMLRIACLPYPRLEASDIELSMPSYTIDTLRRLAASNPGDSFRLVIGADNWECFDRWKDYREILRDFHPIVYPREGCAMPGEDSQATPMWADLLPVSSTMIRQRLITGETVNNLIPPAVLDYIRANGLYRRDDPQVI